MIYRQSNGNEIGSEERCVWNTHVVRTCSVYDDALNLDSVVSGYNSYPKFQSLWGTSLAERQSQLVIIRNGYYHRRMLVKNQHLVSS